MTTQTLGSPTVNAVWNAPYMRSRLGESGPNFPRVGTQSGSPDLIPFGESREQEPARFIRDPGWGQDPGVSTTADRLNYLYMRGANGSRKPMAASVYLYYSPAALLQWPNKVGDVQGWAQRPLKTGDGRDYQDVLVPGLDSLERGRWVTPEAFVWVPQPLPDGDHYCLVGRVSTDQYPNPIPSDLMQIDDFAKYISEHPDLAWRNISMMIPSTKSWIDRPLYLQGEQQAEMVFTVYVKNGVVGDRVTVKPAMSGVDLDMEGLVKIADKPFELTQRAVVPAGWKSEIVITYEAMNKVPDNLSAELEVLRVGFGPNHELAKYARPLRDLGVGGLDDLTPLAIPVGGMHYGRMPRS